MPGEKFCMKRKGGKMRRCPNCGSVFFTTGLDEFTRVCIYCGHEKKFTPPKRKKNPKILVVRYGNGERK
jgi:acetyl-CoA carboxylase beta subunit